MKRSKTFIKFLRVIVGLIFFLNSSRVEAFSVLTHEELTRHAVDISVLDNYLSENLGFQGNSLDELVDTTRSVRDWIVFGSGEEDNIWGLGSEFARFRNHFYNPAWDDGFQYDYDDSTTQEGGLEDGLFRGLSSLVWGVGEEESNNWSWRKAYDYYNVALVHNDQETREDRYAKTFRSLGQVMHLVEDVGSVAHTRNDAHPNPDIFDEYGVGENNPERRNRDAFMDEATEANIPVFDNIADFWTSDPDGAVPVSDGTGLSEFTNYNFFSRDTVNSNSKRYDYFVEPRHTFKNPEIFGIHIDNFVDENGVSRKIKYKRTNVKDNMPQTSTYHEPVNNYAITISLLDKYLNAQNTNLEFYLMNDRTLREQAHYLLPKTVAYAAGVINHFFRGEFDVSSEIINDQYVLHVKNVSQDSTNPLPLSGGKLSLYYDNQAENRSLVPTAQEIVGLSSFDSEWEFDFVPPNDNNGTFTVVFGRNDDVFGMVGEDIGVVGKVVKAPIIENTIPKDNQKAYQWHTDYVSADVHSTVNLDLSSVKIYFDNADVTSETSITVVSSKKIQIKYVIPGETLGGWHDVRIKAEDVNGLQAIVNSQEKSPNNSEINEWRFNYVVGSVGYFRGDLNASPTLYRDPVGGV